MSGTDFNDRKYDPVGACVYCGSDGGDDGLRNEHIIPLSLAGRAILPKASYTNCEGITHRFEAICSRMLFGDLRNILGPPTRRPKERPNTLPLDTRTKAADEFKTRRVAPREYPAIVLLAGRFGPPGLLANRDSGSTFQVELKLIFLPSDARMKELGVFDGATVEMSATFRPGPLAQLLAKIAHCFAVGEIGYDSFNAMLPPYILGGNPNLPYVVGGTDSEIPRSMSDKPRHHLQLQTINHNGTGSLAARIQLFANFGMPTYRVVIGNHTPGLVLP